ncbi:MAG: phosphotriesterase family protein [Jatrophihabitans sp.]
MSDSMVMTVTGPKRVDELGTTLCHEHLLIDLYSVYQPHRDMYLHDLDLAAREVFEFADSGGGTIVDLTTPDIGRNPLLLRQLSEQTGVSVVMGCGRYRGPFYEPGLDARTTASLADEFVEEIECGVDGILPGVIGEIGTDGRFVTGIEERVHRAAARAANRTGLSLVTHSLGSSVGLAQLDLLQEEGLPPERIAIGHADTWPDHDYHLDLAERGVYLLFDTLRGTVPYETERALRCYQVLANAGFGGRVLFSHDVCGTAHYRAYGGNGYTFVGGDLLRQAEDAGIDPADIRQSLTSSAHAFLTGSAVQAWA